jgi:hypothetical protein
MDTFLNDLLNLGAIVRTIILGLIMIFITKAVNKYLSYRSVKSIQRRIKSLENDKLILESLVKSDRSLLSQSFARLFFVIALGSVAFMLRPVISFLRNTSDDIDRSFFIALFGVFILSVQFFRTLKKADEYDESVETIKQKIESLKARLPKKSDK